MAITFTTAHLAEALANLITQFKDKPRLAALLSSYVDQIQQLETVFSELYSETNLENSVGEQLDGLGSIVGESRQGRGDTEYRNAINARILLNISNGTPEDIVAILLALVDPNTIEIVEDYPGHFDVTIVDAITLDGPTLATLVQTAKPAGVRAITIWHETDPYFGFDGDPDADGFTIGSFAGAHDF